MGIKVADLSARACADGVPSAPPEETVVRATDLVKSYGMASSVVHALRGVCLDIGRGERVALLGKSGSGKSTLLNVLGGLDRPSSGCVWVDGQELSQMRGRELARYRLTIVGMIFQSYNLIPSRTAVQNVELPMVFAGRSRAERRAAARQALEAVGLGHRLDHRPAELSGGEQQRIAIARALVNRPEILLADEPTGNLDTETARQILEILNSHIHANNTTLILVTHDEELARRCATRTLRMRDGQLVEEGAGAPT
jgi:predicted ABC-type transport system involved in lysophospholipase L1 biosynthesis ATPase subunit